MVLQNANEDINENFHYNLVYGAYSDLMSDSDKCDENMNHREIDNMNETCLSDDSSEHEFIKKPRSILINHEYDVTKQSKNPNRFVSFSLDDSKKPFTSSIYYGVKSYLHHFYEPINKISDFENALDDDDFEFVVEPGRRRRCCWFGISLFIGITLLLTGLVLILIGNFTPVKNPIVDVRKNLEILDQSVIKFNQKIETLQFLGLVIFTAGGIVVMLTLLLSAYEQECGCHNIRNSIFYPSLTDSNMWIRYADGYPISYDNRIPLSEEIKAVQSEQRKN